MRRYKYSALVKMDASVADADGGLPPGTTSRVTVRATHHQTHSTKFFSALAAMPSRSLSHPGDHAVDITLSVLGEDVPDYLDAGDELAVWRGHDIGHGVITRRLFLWTEAP
jgi:hypothetical protein